MSILTQLGNFRVKFFLWIGLPVIAAMGIWAGATDLGPAWTAKSGGGDKGTFTAAYEKCGRRSCSFYGTWKAAEGGAVRSDVILYDEPDSMKPGDSVDATDSGARNGVFTASGGYTYLLLTAFVVGGVAAAVGWVYFLYRTFTRRRRDQLQPA
jgi:hypothetical protein